MCRLMAYSSKNQTTLPDFMGEAFQQFVELSKVHHDSWGLALVDQGSARLTKKAETAATSSDFSETLSASPATGGLS